jgi:hypothetical protein
LKLGRTTRQLEGELTVEEFAEWYEYFKLDAEERKALMDAAKEEAKAAQAAKKSASRKGK